MRGMWATLRLFRCDRNFTALNRGNGVYNIQSVASRDCALCHSQRAVKHRSLSPDDPFGEKSASDDPVDGFYGAWSNINVDAFANAAASEEVRMAHFGPEWSRFTTIGRLSVKKMNESGSSASSGSEDCGMASQHPLGAEELHMRELRERRKVLERNYSSYDEYVAKELGLSEVDDCDNACGLQSEDPEIVADGEEAEDNDDADEDADNVPLPQFMRRSGCEQEHDTGVNIYSSDQQQQQQMGGVPANTVNEGHVPQRRGTLHPPEPLAQVVFCQLGEPHGDSELPREDPLHWDTEEVILWIRRMEAAQCVLSSGSLACDSLVMEDPSMQEAFRMARIDGDYLLKNTVPATMFQVMRRWHLRRHEIVLAVLKEQQRRGIDSHEINTSIFDDPVMRGILDSGRAKLDEVVLKVTPMLVQETICQGTQTHVRLMADTLSPWDRINRFYHITRKPIHLFVAYHADAAAASLTLTSLLKACFIPFNLHPIAEYAEARDIIQRTSLAQDAELQVGDAAPVDELFLLIGLGASVALFSFFDLQRHIVLVLDSYRPFLLENLRACDSDRLVIWGQEKIHEEVDDFFRTQREQEKARRRRRRRRQMHRRRVRQHAEGDVEEDEVSDEASSSDDDDDDENDDEYGDDDEMTPSQSQERLDWLREDVPAHLERLYYAAECAGKSCALEMYDLAILLNRVKEPVLWHAALGVCDLFKRRLVDYGTYITDMRRIHNEVKLRKGIRHGLLDDLTNDTVNRYHKQVSSSNTMQLSSLEEDQLFLLRHLSLWNAMWLHPVVAGLLSLHRVEEGLGTLRQLLARCGVSAKVAQQPWRELPDDVKKDSCQLVRNELKQLLRTRGSFIKTPIQIQCVARTTGYSVEVSTFDICTLFTALLSAAPPSTIYTTSKDETTMKEKLREFRREQFWRAHDIIDADPNSPAFGAAVKEAQALHESVATATSALMQPGMMQSTKGIHYTQPADPTNTSTALETFGCPFRLGVLVERLLYTLTVERGLGKYTRDVRPVLLSCYIPRFTAAPEQQQQQQQHQQQQQQAEHSFIVVFAHEGPITAGLTPLIPVVRWNDCVTDTEEFLVPPLRDFVRRDAVVVEGRESTAHLAEMLHLHSLAGGR